MATTKTTTGKAAPASAAKPKVTKAAKAKPAAAKTTAVNANKVAKPAAKPAVVQPTIAKSAEATVASAKVAAADAVKTVEVAAKQVTEGAQKGFDKTVEFTKRQVEGVVKGIDEVVVFNRDNVEAAVASSSAAAKGLETLNAEVTSYARRSFEDGVAVVKALSGAKSAKEWFDIQSSFVKTGYEGFISESTKVNEMAFRVANDVFAPISARVSESLERISK